LPKKLGFRAIKSQIYDLNSNAILSEKLPQILAFSRLRLRRSKVTKIALLVLTMTFCALKMIIVSDNHEWDENTPRDVSRYILPGLNFTNQLRCHKARPFFYLNWKQLATTVIHIRSLDLRSRILKLQIKSSKKLPKYENKIKFETLDLNN